jgi:hypothetical protein
MSSATITFDAVLAAFGDWSELASRENDGLAVSLFWSKATNRVKVTVADAKVHDGFELEVPAADALEAFNHPFAYAADRGVCFGDATSESLDLQLQS